MKRLAMARSIVLFFALVPLALPTLAPAEHNFIEDFGSRTYCDSINTTAWWHSFGETGTIELWPFHMGVIGNLPFSGETTGGVALSGNHAFVTIRSSGLRVIDISDPGNPVLIGTCATSGGAYAVAVDGDYAYVADGMNGLRVIDISNPGSPVVVGGCGEGTDYRGVTISGDYAYVAAGASGLVVVDISNPTLPTVAGQRNTPGFAHEVAVSGDYAYVADDASGLEIIGISNPVFPDSFLTYPTPDSARGVVVSGDCAFVAVCGSGLEIVNITNPSSPSLRGRFDTPGRAFGIDVTGDYAYVADGPAGLQAIDVEFPAIPGWKDSCATSDFAMKVVVRGEYAYVADRLGGFKIIHVADATLPPLSAGILPFSYMGQAVDVAGDYAYVVTGANFLVVDIVYPDSPDIAGSCGPLTGSLTGVAVSGDYAYVTALTDTIRVFDVSNPYVPFIAARCVVPSGCYGVAVVGDYAYLAAGTEGLVVIDVSDPTNPVLAGNCPIPGGNAYAVEVSGDVAYVAAGSVGLAVIDISSPIAPTPVTTFATANVVRGIDVSGDLAYLAGGTQGLVILNISTPQSPTLVSVCNVFGIAHSVVAAGRYAFVCKYMALYVINVVNPGMPAIVATYPLQADCYGIAVSGDHAFLPREVVGLEVVQVYQRQFDLQRNQGQSFVFFGSEDEISAARVFATQVDSVYWYVSADSGANWSYVPTDGEWHPLNPPGHDLLWRSQHLYRVYAENPACSNVEIQWKYDFAEIDSVKDVPEDEGGWVRVRFNSSGLDLEGAGSVGRGIDGAGGSGTRDGTFGVNQTDAIRNYGIHRRIDDIGAISKLLEKGEPVEPGKPLTVNAGNGTDMTLELPSSMGGAQAYVMDGHYYYVSQGTGGFPPGIWETVGSVPAIQQDLYYSLVPTVADSMTVLRYTVYCVTAHTGLPTSYFISPPDSGYSRDNLPPQYPADLKGDYGYPPPRLFMSWDRNVERDFSHYAVYKGTTEDFIPNETNRIGTPWDTSFVDEGFDPNLRNYYKVSAWDIHENEGVYSLLRPEDITSVANSPATPTITMLEQNRPNPFNPATVIRFSILQPGRVAVRVYDVAGHPVRTLVDGVKTTGWYEVRWDGRDDYGRVVPSGVYLCKLTAPWHTQTRKMVLIK